MSVQGTVQGIVMLTRHGDRDKFYQDPNTYTGSATHITPLGEAQTYATGQYIRSRYIDPSSPNQIYNISTDTIVLDQCTVTTDAAAEANVIVISAYSMWQGIYPATIENNVTLANGTTIVSPLGGQQYLPIQTVEFNQSPLLEAFTSCPTYNTYLAKFYNSTLYSNYANSSKAFLSSLGPLVENRSHALKDMYNIFDYMNVNSIYNTTYLNLLGNSTLAQTRDIANWLSYYSFTGPSNTSAGNIAGRGVLGNVITSMQTIANATNNNKIQHYSLSYKPFLSLFNMTGIISTNPELAGLVGYASMAVFELREYNNQMYVNFVFRNNSLPGTTVSAYPLLGLPQIPMTTFISALNSSALYTTLDWCRACNQTTSLNGCDGLLLEANSTAIALANGAGGSASAINSPAVTTSDGSHFSAVGAGFIGAILGLLVASIGWFFLMQSQKRRRARGPVREAPIVPLDQLSTDGTAKNPFRDSH